jgi:transposase
MIETGTTTTAPRTGPREVAKMETPDDVAAMLRLQAAGWGAKRIAKEFGCARNTVRHYLRQGGWKPYGGGEGRKKVLDEHTGWVGKEFERHKGNAEVVRQELKRQKGVSVSLRTVERAVKDRRRQLRAETVATVRFETPPGEQLQADFGELFVVIAGERVKVHLCVLTLGYSRRPFVRAYPNERQGNWLDCMERSFYAFGGVPEHVLIDNARALVSVHDVETREVVFTERFTQFATYWGFKPRACAPYRARTKGKDERGVGYVKRNAIAGRSFDSWAALDSWLEEWTRDVADVRVHGTTGERPVDRFDRERDALQPLKGRVPFLAEREFERKVHNDACVELAANWYSVPWKLVGSMVIVRVRDQAITVSHAGRIVARHDRVEGRRQRIVDPSHWEGLARAPTVEIDVEQPDGPPEPEFARSLDVYAEVAA